MQRKKTRKNRLRWGRILAAALAISLISFHTAYAETGEGIEAAGNSEGLENGGETGNGEDPATGIKGYTGLIEQNGKWIYVVNGAQDASITGLVLYDASWFYIEEGELNTQKNGFVEYDGGTFYVAEGRVVSEYSGLVNQNGQWYFIAEGQFQKQYSDLALYDDHWFLLQDGILNTSYNGLYSYDGAQFLIAAGQLKTEFTGLYQEKDVWYFIVQGQVSDYTGLVQYDGSWFLVQDGIVNTGYDGLYDYDNETFLIVSGMLAFGYSGYYEVSNIRYNIVEGQVKNIVPYIHSVEEIREFFKNYPVHTSMAVTYSTTPSIENNVSGVLSATTVQDGLNAINLIRLIAGLPYTVEVSETYSEYAQNAAFVLAKNNTGLSHYPSNTSNIPSELFESGYQGASHSNLGQGYRNLSDSIIRGYMNDGDASNIDRIGHRRWILSPGLESVGFGYCNSYTATYVFDGFDTSRENCPVDYIAWPAENMPIEVFSGPWSFLLPKYQDPRYSSDFADAMVVMTDLKTGQTWVFDKSTNADPSSKPYYSVETSNYGYVNALIFDPGQNFSAGDQVRVEIYGLKYTDGESAPPITYEVSFFSLGGLS